MGRGRPSIRGFAVLDQMVKECFQSRSELCGIHISTQSRSELCGNVEKDLKAVASLACWKNEEEIRVSERGQKSRPVAMRWRGGGVKGSFWGLVGYTDVMKIAFHTEWSGKHGDSGGSDFGPSPGVIYLVVSDYACSWMFSQGQKHSFCYPGRQDVLSTIRFGIQVLCALQVTLTRFAYELRMWEKE